MVEKLYFQNFNDKGICVIKVALSDEFYNFHVNILKIEMYSIYREADVKSDIHWLVLTVISLGNKIQSFYCCHETHFAYITVRHSYIFWFIPYICLVNCCP